MDTKLKKYKFSNRTWVKVVAFLLCIGFFANAIMAVYFAGLKVRELSESSNTRNGNTSLDTILRAESFEDSGILGKDFLSNGDQILFLLTKYVNEESVKAGNSLDEDVITEAVMEYFYDRGIFVNMYQDGSYRIGTERNIETEIALQEDGVYSQDVVGEFTDNGYDRDDIKVLTYEDIASRYPDIKVELEEKYKSEIAAIKDRLIQAQLRDYREIKEDLDDITGFSYYAFDGTNVLTNMPEYSGSQGSTPAEEGADGEGSGEDGSADNGGSETQNPQIDAIAAAFASQPAYMIYNGGQLSASSNVFSEDYISERYMRRTLEDGYNMNDNSVLYMSFDDAYLDTYLRSYSDVREALTAWIAVAASSVLFFLGCLVFLVVTAGRRDEQGNVLLMGFDKIFVEVRLLLIFLLSLLAVGVSVDGYYNVYYDYTYSYGYYGGYYSMSSYYPNFWYAALIAAMYTFAVAAILFIFLSLVRTLKAKRVRKDMVIWEGCRKLKEAGLSLYNGGSVTRKAAILLILVCMCSGFLFLAWPIAAGVAIIGVAHFLKKYEAVKRGLKEVKNGNLSYKIPLYGKGEMEELAGDINEISQGFDLAVQQELKNQRMKSELISNVSHDIKTPLTSIITYVDLLKKEGLDHPDAPKYLEILDQKSARLRKLTEDLFEAAKASSGDLPVNLEKVELMSLINQGLGELEDRISLSGLDFKINAELDKYYVRADGQLLWRVVENLLNNVLKYAQENTRVYLDVHSKANAEGVRQVILELKNVSKDPLNIPVDELMERFKRGDASRTTEGSGLGLSIARDLVNIQGGEFDLVIDGDLFKAIVKLDQCSN